MLKKRKQELSDKPTRQKPLRLWPGIVILILQWLVRFGIPIVIPGAITIGVFGGLLGGLLIVVWWAFFSRAPQAERWGAIILMIAALFATRPLLHKSIVTAGMGVLFFVYAIPVLSLAFVVWAVASRHFSIRPRRLAMVVTILLACGIWTLVRTGGINNAAESDLAWRWSETPEERLLAQIEDKPTALLMVPAETETGYDWPGFRGPDRDGIIRGVRIKTDWSESPPVELWRRPIGPGWSSFAVRGTLLYTQEQRGDDEVVSCYNMTTGDPVWMHSDATRFWESNGGAGPRGTPTLSDGRLYTFGATGILNVLDAGDGSIVWSRNAAADTDTKVPIWGFSSSPLVVNDIVIVAVAGSLIAYDITTENPRWSLPAGGDCYSSPHLLHINGITQILLLNEAGAICVSPSDGTLLWEHPWPGHPIVQPTQIADSDILISVDEKSGVRRITVEHGPDGWTSKELWTSARLKPYFNDSVIHNGHAYGFDGPILACIDIEDGERKWKGGRYGRGQFVLLSDQNLLLVLSEKGDLALVMATPDQFTELGRFPAIKGKTWNHPVLVGDVLVVRNGEEMTAFRLSLVD
ncbi:MAG: PQQ-like beta-propeller repeat protein [Candidatus Aminicenantes bacterium]|nr:PQQ-like beta-propeller repeat protein [Candidatus Aminicenantes bacterium]